MLKLIGYAVLALLLAAAALASFAAFTKPDTFQIERRLVVKAPPEKLWPLVSDLKAFQDFVGDLTALPNVRNVRTALALDRVKDEPIAPLD